MLKVGDITWHYHAGIMTFPTVSVNYDIPLIVWGEEVLVNYKECITK